MYVGMPKIKLRAANGEYTEEGELWHELGGTDPVRYKGELHRTANTQYMLEDGTKHVLKKLVQGPNGPEWRATRKGLRFREHNEWEVLIPAIGHEKERTFEDKIVITDKEVTRNLQSFGDNLDAEPTLYAMMKYTPTHAVSDPEAQKNFIKEALQAHWKKEYPREWANGGSIVIARASDAYWTLDIAKAKAGEGFHYDWKTSYVSDGRLHTETILNRALRGTPYVPIDMLRQMDLIPEASIDLDGYCVPIQLQLCLNRRYHPQTDGERLQIRDTQPRYCVEELKELLEQIHERVYGPRPGKQPTVYQEPTVLEQAHLGRFYEAWAEKIPFGQARKLAWLRNQVKHLNSDKKKPSFPDTLKRVYPRYIGVQESYRSFFRAFFDLRDDTVRRRVLPRSEGLLRYIDPDAGKPGGISANVVKEFCKLSGYPCHIVHKDHTIDEWLPEDYAEWSEDKKRETPRVMFNVYSDHAYFYERSAGGAIAQMKATRKSTPPARLAQHPSDATRFPRTTFEEMQPYSAEALDAVVEARVSTTFRAQDMGQVEADIRARKL